MLCDVVTWENESIGEITVNDGLFGMEPRRDIMASVVRWQRAKARAGTHDVKNRAEITGSTRKIMRQKGSGGARHSTRKVGLFRGGGRAFGPTPRSYAFSLPKKTRRLGLASALAMKLQAKRLIVLADGHLEHPRTKLLVEKLNLFGEVGSALFIVENRAQFPKLCLAASNLYKIDVLPVMGANVYDILRHDTLFVTREAIDMLEKRV
ncbi:MAG: 50S ribosomal protein L4, partial [Alphaproteobacteria bacterium]|nr:50S ribosomal protein L4 [Alphaproteobacteria bacterium]